MGDAKYDPEDPNLPVYFDGPEVVVMETRPRLRDKREFYRGDWQKCWPVDYQVADEEEVARL